MSRARETHCDSKLLNNEENRKIQQLLGQKVISKATSVIQLHTSTHGGPWQHIVTGYFS